MNRGHCRASRHSSNHSSLNNHGGKHGSREVNGQFEQNICTRVRSRDLKMVHKAVIRTEKKSISRNVVKQISKQWKPPQPEELSKFIYCNISSFASRNPKEWLMSKQWRGKLLTGIEGRTVNAQRIAEIPRINKRNSIRHLSTSGHLIHLSQFLTKEECAQLTRYTNLPSFWKAPNDFYLDATHLVTATDNEISSKMMDVDSKTYGDFFAKVRQLALPFMELSRYPDGEPKPTSEPNQLNSNVTCKTELVNSADERYSSKLKIYSLPQSQAVGIVHYYDDNPYTLVVYLNTLNPDEGGETTFPLLTPYSLKSVKSDKSGKHKKKGISILPQCGDAIWFKNDHDGDGDHGSSYPIINARMVHIDQPLRLRQLTTLQQKVRTLWAPNKIVLQFAA